MAGKITGEEDSGLAQQNRTTVFVEDANIKEINLDVSTPNDDIAVLDQNITDFFSKPQLVSIGAWNSSSTAASLLYSFDIAPTITGNTVWSNKYAGFNLIRGTAVIRLQINANPFQHGKLYLCFLPNYADFTAQDFSYGAMHTASLAGIRQLPGVELDCRETTAILKVPYIAPTHWYNIKAGTWDWGRVFLYVLSPMQTGSNGQTAVDYSVYMSFDDFELAAPSIPQGVTGKRVRGKTFKKAPSEEEVRKVGTPIADALSHVSMGTGGLSSIPILAPVMRPLSWASGALSKAAGYLGWSKPTLTTSPTYMVRKYLPYSGNCDGMDTSYKMSLSSTNGISLINSIAPTEQDEMSFAFLKKVSTICKSITWTTSDAIGTSLLHQQLAPANLCQTFGKTAGGHTASLSQGPPINFLHTLFSNWRGGLRLVLKFVKTDFHTGRVMITWTPTGASITAPVYNGNSQYSLRHIVDLREGSEICLDLPFIFGSNFLSQSEYSGQLDITVLNVLRAPETCSSNIKVLVYYSGADDFEFAVPTDPSLFPFSPQIGELDCQSIGGYKHMDETTKFAELSVGEKFTSIRQLLKRMNRFWTTVALSPSFYLWPWFKTINAMNGSSGALIYPNIGGDPFSMLSSMFAYYRGSVRIIYNGNGEKTMYAWNIPNSSFSTAWGTSTTPVPPGTNANIGHLNTSNGTNCPVAVQDPGTTIISAEAPYYCAYQCSPNFFTTDGTSAQNAAGQSFSVLGFNQSDATSEGMFRGIGEDFQLAYFIGCPPVMYGYS